MATDRLPSYDLACVIHLHSTHSDGTGTVAEIARAGSQSGVDVVLLTDHDSLAARHRGEEGWYEKTLLLCGEEVSPLGGNHFLAFGIDAEIDHRGLSPAAICDTVAQAGGFGFVAHPFSKGSQRFGRLASAMPWNDLDHHGVRGIELWSFVTDSSEGIERLSDVAKFVVAPNRYVTHPPKRNLAEWDRLCQTRRVAAIGGLDAHQFGLRIAGRVPIRAMSYKRSFRHLRTHALLAEPLTGDLQADRRRVFEALSEGSSYLAMDSLAPARGFSFWAESAVGQAQMGSEHPASDGFTLRAQLPEPAVLRLVRDGSELQATRASALEHAATEPGVYRVEALRESAGRLRTWIISNPIYLR